MLCYILQSGIEAVESASTLRGSRDRVGPSHLNIQQTLKFTLTWTPRRRIQAFKADRPSSVL